MRLVLVTVIRKVSLVIVSHECLVIFIMSYLAKTSCSVMIDSCCVSSKDIIKQAPLDCLALVLYSNLSLF